MAKEPFDPHRWIGRPVSPKAIQQLAQEFYAEAEDYGHGSMEYYETHPDIAAEHQAGNPEEASSSGATRGRIAKVYQETADRLDATAKKLTREIVRQSNPYFAKYSNAKIDKIIAQEEERDRKFAAEQKLTH